MNPEFMKYASKNYEFTSTSLIHFDTFEWLVRQYFVYFCIETLGGKYGKKEAKEEVFADDQ